MGTGDPVCANLHPSDTKHVFITTHLFPLSSEWYCFRCRFVASFASRPLQQASPYELSSSNLHGFYLNGFEVECECVEKRSRRPHESFEVTASVRDGGGP
eukprot:4213872-Pyramimonas_sp.AAC.2